MQKYLCYTVLANFLKRFYVKKMAVLLLISLNEAKNQNPVKIHNLINTTIQSDPHF